jgi:hypothetical protein
VTYFEIIYLNNFKKTINAGKSATEYFFNGNSDFGNNNNNNNNNNNKNYYYYYYYYCCYSIQYVFINMQA